jgi:hypothetical protein
MKMNMDPTQATSPRQRLQDLLAIPERQRTDAEWDEINELEIKLAQGNREGGPDPNAQRKQPGLSGPPRSGGGQGQSRSGGGGQGKKPFAKSNKRSQRRNPSDGR